MTSSNDDGLTEYERDKIRKQSLVLSAVSKNCSAASPFEDVRTIASALESGEAELAIENLSGGCTNYTYRVYLVPAEYVGGGPAEVLSTALFVKLCFERCFWNPDPEYKYDVRRIANEYGMMQRFAELAPGCVATPYFLLDIDDMKLLATQWSSADEQMANQFIDGAADARVARGLASAVAGLHCSEMDPNFNAEARECMIDVFPAMEEELLGMCEANGGGDRASKIANELGRPACEAMFDRARESYRSREIPTHTDLHMFNVLVEKKPDVGKMEVFGQEGSFCICDWEMLAGPLGLDMGRLYSIPAACILAHAISGNNGVEDGIMEWLNL